MIRSVLQISMVGFLLLSAGCGGIPASGDHDGPVVVDASGPNRTQMAGHGISVANEHAENTTVRLTVERGDRVIFDKNYTVRANSTQLLAGFTRESLSNPSVANVTLTTENGNTATVSKSINSCLGNIRFVVKEDSVRGIYSIC